MSFSQFNIDIFRAINDLGKQYVSFFQLLIGI
ncbi:hypothetical protein BWGOE8_55530 [Bacillus mycoides]|uniref:Uncharacterized protein n=1 Tax=Bacillus mycoides TaxID=1405 RepID=A0A1E8AYX5_BACMY|nr:hypothetical protein BWGOE9_59000 [Bacillus mycoides]OFD70856.1 hypothetical protein BWGOE8_55530 [Bacillus mycoides]OFD71477.1 hypothetical protein BWGOE10_56730 [Bacillus mycoides]